MSANLEAMLEKFGSVTVMDVDFYEPVEDENGIWSSVLTFSEIDEDGLGEKTIGDAIDPIARIDTLKISNLTQEGPAKTATGGQNAEALLKYGKTMRIEMQDALGRYAVLENLYGIQVADKTGNDIKSIAITDLFAGVKTIVGTTFYVDQVTGAKQPVKIVIPYFLADSILNLTGEAEGDVSVFDINGDILKFFEKAGTVGDDGLYDATGGGWFYAISTLDRFDKMTGQGQTYTNFPDETYDPEE